MKNAWMRMAICAAAAWTGCATADVVYLAEVTDFAKQRDYQVLNAADFRALQKTVESEAAVYPKALEFVRKVWESGSNAPAVPVPAKKGAKKGAKTGLAPIPPNTPFPSGFVAARRVEERGMYTSADEANKHRQELEQQAAAELAKENKPAKKPASVKDRNGRTVSSPNTTDEDRKRKAREQEERALAQRAGAMLEEKVAQLLQAAATATAAPAAAGT